jgi:hypothetical protein
MIEVTEVTVTLASIPYRPASAQPACANRTRDDGADDDYGLKAECAGHPFQDVGFARFDRAQETGLRRGEVRPYRKTVLHRVGHRRRKALDLLRGKLGLVAKSGGELQGNRKRRRSRTLFTPEIAPFQALRQPFSPGRGITSIAHLYPRPEPELRRQPGLPLAMDALSP